MINRQTAPIVVDGRLLYRSVSVGSTTGHLNRFGVGSTGAVFLFVDGFLR